MGKTLPRRTFLRGSGTAVALPFLDAMVPAFASSTIPGKPPVRMAFVYVPNGIEMRHWTPEKDGPLGTLPRVLEPLQPFKKDLLVLSNLTHNNARALLDGAGDHGRCCATYLTGARARKSAVDIRAGISCDQIVANKIGEETRLPSLEVGLEEVRRAGDCDSGYSCAYTNNLAWRNEKQPLPPILNPRDLFERFFGHDAHLSPEVRTIRNRFRRSILDLVREDTRTLQRNLGPTDKRKLEEYLDSVRNVEKQVAKNEVDNFQIDPEIEKPYGIPSNFAEHFRLMTDMITIAFQADISRVVTFLVTQEGSERPYREIGIPDGHHPLTHHRYIPERIEKVVQINRYHMEQFATWITKLKAAPEGDATLLDNSMIVYGAGLSDGNRHTHDDLPTLIAGSGGGYFNTGRHLTYRRETPMSNLFLTMMDRMGVHTEHFGDSTGHLPGLTS